MQNTAISAVESGRHGAKMPFELWNTWRDSNINCWNAAGNNGNEIAADGREERLFRERATEGHISKYQ